MNNKQAQQMMRRMGINQQEIAAQEVIIRCEDKLITIQNPQVSKINMAGQEMFQVTGTPQESALKKEISISQQDIETVMQQAGVSQEVARQAIVEHDGDLAQAILELTK